MLASVRDLFRKLWTEPRAPAPPRPSRRDALLLAAAFALGVIEVAARPELTSVDVIASMVLLPTLLWRRQRPFAMAAIAFGTCTLLALWITAAGGVFESLHTLALLLLLPYSLLRWGSGRDAVLGLPIMLAAAASDLVSGPIVWSDIVGGFAVLVSAMALGAAVRYRERAQQRGLEQAKLEVREQLARDLHDTVAHHVSAIAIRAQAGLAVAQTRPEAAAEALRLIASEASRTLTEMRTMVRVLRHGEPATLAPAPQLIDLARGGGKLGEGPRVEVLLSGDLDALPASLSTALYRLAQEAITNARRHARAATRIDVAVHAEAALVRLQVRDDGELAHVRTPPGAGYGLVGMVERAQQLGGTCNAGPAPERGWTVTVVLPRTEASL